MSLPRDASHAEALAFATESDVRAKRLQERTAEAVRMIPWPWRLRRWRNLQREVKQEQRELWTRVEQTRDWRIAEAKRQAAVS